MPEQPKLPFGFRYINEDDVTNDLKSFVAEMDKYVLEDYYSWSLDENSLVIIREIEEKIAAVALVTLHDDHLMLEMLARNKLHSYHGSAGDLVILVEKLIAPHYGKKEIRLEAMEHILKYYSQRGYEIYGKPYHDDNWGDLTPMRKRLVSS
jgi:predicted GNAT family N-acyltransferase